MWGTERRCPCGKAAGNQPDSLRKAPGAGIRAEPPPPSPRISRREGSAERLLSSFPAWIIPPLQTACVFPLEKGTAGADLCCSQQRWLYLRPRHPPLHLAPGWETSRKACKEPGIPPQISTTLGSRTFPWGLPHPRGSGEEIPAGTPSRGSPGHP